MTHTDDSPDQLIGSRKVRKRYNDVSDMTLWRWEHDQRLGFPPPIYISRRRYWRLADLAAWERSRAAAEAFDAAACKRRSPAT